MREPPSLKNRGAVRARIGDLLGTMLASRFPDRCLTAPRCWVGFDATSDNKRPAFAGLLPMEENGARLNRDQLASAHRLIRSLATRTSREIQSQRQIRPRAGAVQAAVIRALAG